MIVVLVTGWAVLFAIGFGRVALWLAERARVPRGARVIVRVGTWYRRAVVSGPGFDLVRRVGSGLLAPRARRRHDATVARDFPAAVDLVAVAVTAGATPLVALEVVREWAPPRIAAAFDRALGAFRLGAPLHVAFAMAAREEAVLVPLTDVLASAARLGTPVGESLARLSREHRQQQRRDAEARARTIPVRLLFPLVFLVLPAFGILTVIPAIVTGWRGA